MTHRLFLAVPFPASFHRPVSHALDRVSQQLPQGAFRFVDSGLWHTTLLFLGDQEEEGLADIVNALQSVELPPIFEDVFERLDYGPDAKNPRMLWLWGSDTLSQKLEVVRDDIQDALIEHGVQFAPDNRRFFAHVTVARSVADRPRGLEPINETLKVPAVIDELQLIESALTSNGPEYTVFGSFPFA